MRIRICGTDQRMILLGVGVLTCWFYAGASTGLAAEKTIEAKAPATWRPNVVTATVGDTIEWKLAAGSHGVRITNWAAVKNHVDIMPAAGQHPFNATEGKNDTPTDVVGKVLLKLKIKSAIPAPAEISYNCIVHGRAMNGKVSVSGETTKLIEAKAGNKWQPSIVNLSSGETIEWKMGPESAGAPGHGVRITNWEAVKNQLEIVPVLGQQPFNATAGENDAATTTPGKVLLRLKVKSTAPSSTEILFNCAAHGAEMNGKATISGTAVVKTTKSKDIPNVKMQTQDNKTIRFYEDLIKDKTFIVNFFYSRCDGRACDEGMKNLAKVQESLGNRLGKEVFIYSITLDPEHDTPTVLKEFAESLGAKPGWIFLTGRSKDIAELRRKLGLANLTAETRKSLGLKELPAAATNPRQHTGMIVVGSDAYDRWEKVSILQHPSRIVQILDRIKPPPASKK